MAILFTFLTLSVVGISLSESLHTQEEVIRCSESCLRINPYDSSIHSDSVESQMVKVKHCAYLTPDQKCECDWEKILTETGSCMCRNPNHTINENNKCVCDLSHCEINDPMKNCKLLQSSNLESCTCPIYQCEDNNTQIEVTFNRTNEIGDICPEDSFRSNQSRNGGCLCYPCKINECKSNQSTVIIRKGNKKPGSCCDLYRCDDLFQKKNCLKDGKTYQDGESWMQGKCNIFRCENGILFQELKEECHEPSPCLSKGYYYPHGVSWQEDDCTNCTCNNGTPNCMAHFCKELPVVVTMPPLDCPYMLDCPKKCIFGFKVNRQGCEMCKCRPPDAKTVQEILKAVNCTPEVCDTRWMMETSGRKFGNDESGNKVENFAEIPWKDISWGSIVFFLVLTNVYLLYKYHKENKRADLVSNSLMTLESRKHKYLQIPMLDDNRNASKQVLQI